MTPTWLVSQKLQRPFGVSDPEVELWFVRLVDNRAGSSGNLGAQDIVRPWGEYVPASIVNRFSSTV